MIYSNSMNNNSSTPSRRTECITIWRMAPDFIALSTQGYIRLADYRGKWVIIASQPMAFGAVATTELISAAQSYEEFLKRDVVVIGLTTDNIYSNLAWVYDIYQKTGITIPYPIIADPSLEISELYGMLNPDRLYGETVRDTFIINPNGRIQAILTLPNSCGRSTEEIIRIIDSLQLTADYGLQTPANWEPGDPVVVEPTPTTYDDLINRVNTKESQGLQCPFWYLCYTNMNTVIDADKETPKLSEP